MENPLSCGFQIVARKMCALLSQSGKLKIFQKDMHLKDRKI